MAMLCAKQRCNYKNNIPAYFKTSLNQTIKIKLTKIIKLLRSQYKAFKFNLAIYKVC